MKLFKKNSLITTIIETVLILTFSFSFAYLTLNFILDKKSEQKMDDLRAIVKSTRYQYDNMDINDDSLVNKSEKKKENEKEEKNTSDNESQSSLNKVDNRKQNEVLDIYKELKDQNPNFAGWLYVEDTNLEYPIMQGPNNKFYLSHDMNRGYDKYGMLIMDVNCDASLKSPQTLIYGHNVNSGKLFGELLFYKEEAYCNYHPIIKFDTLYDRGEYEIFSAFITDVNEAEEKIGLFTTWNFEDETKFNDFVSWCKEKSLYKREFTPKIGDEILTLVTCEHSNDKGRFVVMAAKKK